MIRTSPLFALIAILAIAACTTTPASLYRPADKNMKNSIGYTDQQIDPTRTRISYIVPQASGGQMAQDLALLRAADLTTAQGHTWFRLLNKTLAQVQVERPKAVVSTASSGNMVCNSPSTNAGGPSIGCTYTPTDNAIGGVEVTPGGGSETRLLVVIEITMGDGALPAGDQVYDAKATADRLRAALAAQT
jgi:hypothetical protein